MSIFLEDYVDQRAMKYSLLRSPNMVIGTVTFYLFAIYAGKKIMATRKPCDLRTFVAVYNIALVVICIYITKLAFAGGFRFDFLWRCYAVDYSSQTQTDLTMVTMCYLVFLSKVLELVETIVFVLRKKNNQVSLLHVYHHASTVIFTWFFARSIGGGMQSFNLVINLMVHVLMYSYYFLSSLGPTVQRRLALIKKYITAIQITQLSMMLINTFAHFACDNIPKTILWFFIPNVTFILYMFLKFYSGNYLKSKNKKCEQ